MAGTPARNVGGTGDGPGHAPQLGPMSDWAGEIETLQHYPQCFGCGTANERGLRLAVEWRGGWATLEHVPPVDAEGGPGIVHGGYIGALADEVMALVAARHCGAPAMSRRIEVDFLAPALVGSPLHITSWVQETGTRRIVTRLRAESPGGSTVYFAATGVFLQVPRRLWTEAMEQQGRGPDKVDWSGGDASTYHTWQMRGGLRECFFPGRMSRHRRIALVLADVRPREWMIHAGPDGLSASAVASETWDVRFTGTFRQWQRLIRQTLPREELLGDPAAAVEGDWDALVEFAGAIQLGRSS